jgi:aldose 1-epimerase
METKHKSQSTSNLSIKSFGTTPDGQEVESCELVNNQGTKAEIITFGASLRSLKLTTKDNKTIDVVLGFNNIESYAKSFELDGCPYFGATVGRYAGRINNSVFALNNKQITLNTNNFNHSLHGGIDNFSRKVWDIKTIKAGNNPAITLSYLSKSNEENYPGDLSVEITYTLTEENELVITYQATTTEDTVINLTHHSYFNLDGHEGTVLDQKVNLPSNQRLDITNEGIPTGKFIDLTGTDFDFRTTKNCPAIIDNSFIIENKEEVVATLLSVKNNLKMDVYTDQPSVHIYVGGKCDAGLETKENIDYHSQSGICFETQNYPDAPNQAHFPNSVLKSNEIYQQKTTYKFINL